MGLAVLFCILFFGTLMVWLATLDHVSLLTQENKEFSDELIECQNNLELKQIWIYQKVRFNVTGDYT